MPTRRFRLTLFALLYFVQGAAHAYLRNFQKPYLDGFHIDADAIGLLTTILLLPFVLKVFIGILSDRVNLFRMGHRKPYMILGLLLSASSFAGVAFAPPDRSFFAFAALIVAGSFSVALFDSTTDGLAIDITPPEEHGTVQGVMVGARSVAIILLSLVFGQLVGRLGYSVIFLLVAGLMLLPIFWVVRLQEPTGAAEKHFEWSAFRTLLQPRFLIFAGYAIFYSIVSFGTDGVITYFMRQNMAAADSLIGNYGALHGIGSVGGALLGGVLIDRLGRRRCAYGALALLSLGAILFGLTTGIPMLMGVGLFWGVAWAFQETIYFALAMDLADRRIAASMFAIMMAVSNLGTAVGEGLATGLTDNLGFQGVFFLLAGVNLFTAALLYALLRAAPEMARRRAAAA